MEMVRGRVFTCIVAGISIILSLALLSGWACAAEDDNGEKEVIKNDNAELFLFVMLLSFGVGAIILGAFTAYFGSGKSRVFGALLTVAGILVYLNYIYFKFISKSSDTLLGIVHWSEFSFVKVLLVVVGFIVGLIIALALFLVGIIKS